ncbi:hypothetical protein KAR91_26275, partial [Candidatus Pacearchaeota archaeon]|nr:hypothetical protein [Candidatus Pacearchaeota archaeon]
VLKNVIEKKWDSKKTHIIGHSSGYDSRTISNIIKELGEKNGKKWLGKVIYVELLGESEGFRQIMEAQELTGIIYREGVPPGEHHAYSFNFKTFYKKFNGVASFPVNQWYDGYKHLEEMGILDSSNVQCFTGYGANEVMELAHKKYGLEWYFQWHHYLQIQNFRLWGENWVHPYWDFEFLSALAGFQQAKFWKKRIAVVMSDTMVEHLQHIPNAFVRLENMKKIRTLSDRLLKSVNDSYAKSWYGKQVKVPIKRDFTKYYSWWTHYCVASICEHLLEKGYKIS